uniref:Uncharacterized protein n=1 Tax=Nelumbo nucifera TaxID=4432 RepID=A0A822YQJ3_NELNU|nr:TPA_asm: hypothetical protein HUJ06_010339 [Nelumbo nucifera]
MFSKYISLQSKRVMDLYNTIPFGNKLLTPSKVA